MGLKKFEWGCLGVVALTFLVRAYYVLHPAYFWDSAWYLMLSRSFAERGDFWIRWTDPAEVSRYWPPLFPVLASPFVKVFGASYTTTALVATLASAALCGVVLVATWDLYDRTRAFAAMAIVAASPPLLRADFLALSESTLALVVALTLYFFLKSLKRKRWLLPAALFGVLTYFGKPNLGLPLVAGALLALAAWRVRWRGWRTVARDPVDVGIAAAALVALLVFALASPAKLGGLGIGVIEPLKTALLTPMWPVYFLLKLAFVASLLLIATLPLSLSIREVLRKPRTEADGYLLIFVAMVALSAALFTSAFVLFEHRAPDLAELKAAFAAGQGVDKIVTTLSRLAEFDNMRYVTPGIVPLAWLLLPRVPFEDDVSAPAGTSGDLRRKHLLWYGAAAGGYAALVFMSPMEGQTTPGRFFAFLALALVPILLTLGVRATNYGVQARKGLKGEEHRFVPRKAPALPPGALAIVLVIGGLMGFFFSWYYVAIALAVVVAVATGSQRLRALAMPVLLCGISIIGILSPYPVEPTAHDVSALIPPGSALASGEPIVYFAAVAPGDHSLRFVDLGHIGEDVTAFVAFRPDMRPYENFTVAKQWFYTFNIFPTTRLRLEIERVALGNGYSFQEAPGLALYVRTNATVP